MAGHEGGEFIEAASFPGRTVQKLSARFKFHGKEAYDLIVLGGGGASSLAIRAGQEGWKTALVEQGPLGGTCPNLGCIPSKRLLQHALMARSTRGAAQFHIRTGPLEIDTGRIFSDVRRHISGTPERIRKSLGRRVTLFSGHGELLDAHSVQVGDQILRAPRLVIATGLRPTRPEGIDPREIPYLVSDDLFAMKRAPPSMVIVGGGLIACEFASFFSAVGTHVTLVTRGAELLGAEDKDIRKAFRAAFAERVDLRTRTIVGGVTYRAGRFRVQLESNTPGSLGCEALLYATGRTPNTDGIGIERAGIALDERGFVRVNRRLETNVKGVYALGDVNGLAPFTHAATAQRGYLIERFFGGRSTPMEAGPIPHAVFTDPEIASVGETEDALKARGAKYVKSVMRYDEVAKGAAMKEKHGIAKVLASPKGRILGFHIVGPDSSILIHEVIPVIRWRNHLRSLTDVVTSIAPTSTVPRLGSP